jgi:hypothetical protein
VCVLVSDLAGRKASQDMLFESCMPMAARGDEHRDTLAVNDITPSTAAPTAVLEHSLGAVIWVWQVNGFDDNEHGEHGGQHGRPLGAQRAGGSSVGGIGGAFFVFCRAARGGSAAAR